MHTHKGRLDAYTVYLIYSGANSLFFSLIVTVNMIYQVEIAKLSPLQLVLVGTALETVCFLCQVPTGVLADVYSRRLSVILGVFILGAGFVLEGSIPNFLAIVVGQALFGIGATFTDGAEQAWITDEIGEERVGRAFMRSTQIGLIGGLIGGVIGIALGSIRLNIPIVVGGAMMMLLAVFLLLFMPENGFKPAMREERHSWREMGNTFKNGIRVVRIHPVLITILLIGLFYGLYSEGFDRLWTAHFLTDFTFPTLWHLQPVVWLGGFRIVGSLLTLGATEFITRRVDTTSHRLITRALFVINTLMVLSLLSFGLVGNFVFAVAAYLAFSVFRSVNQPLYTTWLTRNIDAKVRATVISMSGQIDAFGQIAGGPPVGLIGTLFSLRVALVATSIILSPVLLLFAYVFRKGRISSTL